MDLRSYLDTLPHGGISDFAAVCGISEVYLHQLAVGQGGRRAAPKLAAKIEKLSGGSVTRKELRPEDYAEVWPDLAADEVKPARPRRAAAGASTRAAPRKATAAAADEDLLDEAPPGLLCGTDRRMRPDRDTHWLGPPRRACDVERRSEKPSGTKER